MNRCADMVTLMSEEIDGCLDRAAHDALLAHLDTCAACRRTYDELTRAMALVRAVPPRPAPPDMVARVRRRLERPPAAVYIIRVVNRPAVRMALAASIMLMVSFYALRRPELLHESATKERHIARDSRVEEPAQAPAAGPAAPDLGTPAEDAASRPEPDSLALPRPAVEATRAVRHARERRDLADVHAMDHAHAPPRRRPVAMEDSAPVDRQAPGAMEDLAEAEDGAAVARAIGLTLDRGARAAVDAAAAPPPAAAPLPDVDHVNRLAAANRAFAADMYHALAAQQDGNIFFSPYSMYTALGMALAGADGDTARDMASALHWPYARPELPLAFRALNRRLAAAVSADGQQLRIANGLWLTGGDVATAYRNLLRDSFGAEIVTGGLADINAWVTRETNGSIDRMLDPLSPHSICVLMNAIYFKGVWRDRFDPQATHEAAFHLTPDRQTSVPMMHRTGLYRLLEADAYQAIAIPYQGDGLSMIVVLPREIDDMTALESRLSAQTFVEWSSALSRQPERRVQVHLPRFKIEADYDLLPPCRRLGMHAAFMRGAADFSGMGWTKGELWISQARHKAVVAVDEDGAEAAAATAVDMQSRAAQPPDPVFRADRPFLFLIQDNVTGGLLFIGRVREI